jgi:DNA invertase Pin-like site-specific DNA recombinase
MIYGYVRVSTLPAEPERNLISRRARDAPAGCRPEGKVPGRHPGKAARVKLSGHEKGIRAMLNGGASRAAAGRYSGVRRQTVRIFTDERIRQASRGK